MAKVSPEQIVPRYGIAENIDSDQGNNFTSQVLQGLMQALEIEWAFHTPWHPSSSGKAKRMNQTLKKQLTKLALKTQLPWVKCLLLALLQVQTAPRNDIGISPYEMLFGLPYLGRRDEIPQFETREFS